MNKTSLKIQILNKMIELKTFTLLELYICIKDINGKPEEKLQIITKLISMPLIKNVFEKYYIDI